MENEIEEDVVFFSAIRLFMRREISRIRGYFEVTVPVYELDVFRSHFRMTRTTFELLAQMIIPSEHIPNGNAFIFAHYPRGCVAALRALWSRTGRTHWPYTHNRTSLSGTSSRNSRVAFKNSLA